MDFFEHQDIARRKTGHMVFLFVLAVIGIVIALNVVFAGLYIYGIGGKSENISAVPFAVQLSAVPAELWIGVTVVTLLVICSGSIFRILQLNDGGEAVARMVGARKVSRSTTEPNEKRLLNVVDEMSIASGIPVPQVFIMDDEPGINAFAAGYEPNEAVVAVTRGTLEQLDRDELQGVVAHEFSHIFNGDMRLNIRLMGVLYGILVIGTIGSYFLRSARYSSVRSRDNKSAGAVLVIGLSLFVVGYTGVFFARLIKAGVSRQREFLADSSAVQYTRNPEGISYALKKIGNLESGSLIQGEHAEEMSHMYFSEGITTAMSGLMATHPPLVDRIKRLNQGRMPPPKRKPKSKADKPSAKDKAAASGDMAGGVLNPANIAETIGNPNSLHMIYAAALLASIPETISDAVALEKGSMALMVALILDDDPDVRRHEMAALKETPHHDLKSEVIRLAGVLDKLHARYRLPLFDLAVPTIKEMPKVARESFLTSIKVVIDADRRIKLDELTIYVLLRANLGRFSGQASEVRYKTFGSLKGEVELLLSLLAYLGDGVQHSTQDVFDRAAKELESVLPDIKLVSLDGFNPEHFVQAMQKFADLAPALKARLTAACIAAVMADGVADPQELEVMRGLCASMDVPIPPVLLDIESDKAGE